MATLGVGKHPYQMRLAKASNDQLEKKTTGAGKGKTLRTPQTQRYPLVKITEQEDENEAEERKSGVTMQRGRRLRRNVVVKDDASSSEEDSEDDSSSSSGSTSSSESDCDSCSGMKSFIIADKTENNRSWCS